jgi:ATP-binding cassette subfamily B protein
MEHGRVVEQGTHDELLSREGVYAKMWSLQWQQGELEHTQRKLTAQPVRLGTLASGVIAALRAQIAEKRVHLSAVVAESDLLVWGDPAVLQQVVADLCRYEIARAEPGDRVELRSERKPNRAISFRTSRSCR